MASLKERLRAKKVARIKEPVEDTVAVRNIVGICNHNPYQVTQLLGEQTRAMMSMDGSISGPKRADYLLVPLVAVLLQFREAVLAFKGTVLVFDDPVKLDHVLHTENILDVVTKNHSYQYTFGPLTPAKLEHAKVIRRPLTFDQDRIDVLPQLINAVQGSIAQVIMEATQSLIPTVKSDVFKIIFSRLSLGSGQLLLDEELKALGVEDPEAMLLPLTGFLATEQGAKAAQAFKMMAEYKDKGKTVPYAKIEKVTGVPSFDLQFAVRHIRRTVAVRRPGMTLTQIHAARKLKSNNDILAGIDEEDA